MEKRYLALAGGLFLAGILSLAHGVSRGEVAAGIALFIPFVYGTGPFASLGVLLVFLGMLALFFSILKGAVWAPGMDEEEQKEESSQGAVQSAPQKDGGPIPPPQPASPKMRGGAVIMIGPIPIIAGSDTAMTRNLMILALMLMAASIVLVVLLALR